MIPSILVALLDPMDRPIAFDCPGASVEKMAADLTKATGLKVKAGPSVQKEILFVHVRAMPIRKILDEVTGALGAGWKEERGEILLFRSNAQDKAQVAAERKLKIDALKVWRDAPLPDVTFNEDKARGLILRAENLVKNFTPSGSSVGPFQLEMAQIGKEGPAPISAARLRKGVDIELIADVGVGRRYTFSTKPNRLQKPLRGGEEAIREYGANLELSRTMSEASLARVPAAQYAADPRQWPLNSKNAPDKALISAYRLPGMPQILIRTYFVSGSTIVGWISESVDPVGTGASAGTFTSTTTPAKPALPAASFKVDERLGKIYGFEASNRAVGQPLIERKLEPAAWVVGPLLSGYSKARNVDLIAVVPDQATDASCGLPIKPSDAMANLTGLVRRYWTWKEANGLMILTPNLPVEARANAFDRERFWKLSDDFKARGFPTLEKVGGYLAQESVEPVHATLLGRLTFWTTGQLWDFAQWYNSPPLRFWGRLPGPAQNGAIEMRQITGPARTALNEWIFGTNLGLQALDPPKDREEGLGIRRLEPTEMLPDGFPDGMIVNSTIAAAPTLWRRADTTSYAQRLEDSYDVVYPSNPPDEMVALSSRRVLQLVFEHGISMRVQADEPDSPNNLTWKPVKDLPDDVLKKLRDLAEKFPRDPSKRSVPPPSVTR